MTIGAGLFLGLLPLVAAPILFHLLKRRQRKTIMFSTELFFDSMKPRLSFHRKFREPLLLATRTLLLLFLCWPRTGSQVYKARITNKILFVMDVIC